MAVTSFPEGDQAENRPAFYVIPLAGNPCENNCIILSKHCQLKHPLDNPRKSGIIKARVSKQSGFDPSIETNYRITTRKPSLCRVAVFPFYPQCEHKSKQMERNGNRHCLTSFPEGDQAENRPISLCKIPLAGKPCENNCTIWLRGCQLRTFNASLVLRPSPVPVIARSAATRQSVLWPPLRGGQSVPLPPFSRVRPPVTKNLQIVTLWIQFPASP